MEYYHSRPWQMTVFVVFVVLKKRAVGDRSKYAPIGGVEEKSKKECVIIGKLRKDE